MFLSGRVKSQAHGYDLYDWLQRFKHDGITPTLRMELREILTPRVTLRERMRWSEESAAAEGTPERIRDILDWELVLSADHVHTVLHDLQSSTAWKGALPEMLPDFNVLLRDALDLMRELGGADDHSDSSYFAQPSIGEHPQNNDFHDWSALIILLRDAWLDTVKTNPTRAKHYVEGWWDTPYPLFKRLTFFAAANTEVVTCKEAVDWLLAENHWWLWSVETQREAIRLLVVLAPKLDAITLERLEQAILQGPPREMFRDGIEPDEWKSLVDHEIWLRLAKVHATGALLGQYSIAKLCEIRLLNPLWSIGADEREEFPYWSGGGDERRKYVATPRRRCGLMEFITKPIHEYLQVDDWHQRCREDFATTSCALCGLAQKGQWPVDRWRVALQAWAEDKLLKRSWRYMARLINQMPEGVFQTLSHGLSWWLRAQSKMFEGQEELYFSLIRRLLAVEYEETDETDDPVSRAINHPIGHATEAMLNWWYRHEPKDSQGIKGDVQLVFTLICDTSFRKFRHGRVALAAHTISLFRVDEEWTSKYLLPLFNWQKSNEAHAVWVGFLGSPRLYRPLLRAIKVQLLETALHYGDLGKYAKQYADFLTFAALDPGDIFTTKELAAATQKLPADGLQSAAQALIRALEGAGEQRDEYWRNRVLPYLKSIWPKSRNIMTPAISERLGRLCVAAREAFPDAMKTLRYWLQPIEQVSYLIHLLNDAKLCQKFPSEALAFLNEIIGENVQWLPEELIQCLNDIGSAEESLLNDRRFVRLTVCCARQGFH